jgi:hypothetical protein
MTSFVSFWRHVDVNNYAGGPRELSTHGSVLDSLVFWFSQSSIIETRALPFTWIVQIRYHPWSQLCEPPHPLELRTLLYSLNMTPLTIGITNVQGPLHCLMTSTFMQSHLTKTLTRFLYVDNPLLEMEGPHICHCRRSSFSMMNLAFDGRSLEWIIARRTNLILCSLHVG